MASFCIVCDAIATKICGGCRKVSYCCVEHQRANWKTHKSSCRVYIVKCNGTIGRYIVAVKDIPAGTVIMDEPAVMIGPKQDTLPVCLACYKRVNGAYLCSKCGLAMCNSGCEKVKLHADNECSIFSTRKRIRLQDFDAHHPIYQSILTLRCLLLKEKDEERWRKLNTMEHHNTLRQSLSELWNRNEVNTVKFLREAYGLPYESMEIHSVLGFADINAFEIKREGSAAFCGLFPEVSLMAHDCISNTHHSVTDDNRMIVRSTVEMKKGDMITTTYTHTLDGTLERRSHILSAKLFSCNCARCSSPTEMGTNFSSVKCPHCAPGYFIPKDPLNASSLWACDCCKGISRVEQIQSLVQKIRQEIERIERDGKVIPIPKLEVVLQKNSGVTLHPNHYLMVGIMHTLSQFYGRITNYVMEELTLEQLKRKEELCFQLLEVLDILEPGMSRIRGLTLYELHAAIFYAAQKQFKNKEMGTRELREALEQVLKLLMSAQEILIFDSPSSGPGKIARHIPNCVDGVRSILEHFCHAK